MRRATLIGLVGLLAACGPAWAQTTPFDEPGPARQGGGFLEGGPGTGAELSIARNAGVFHGNYCGPGDNGPGLPPTDALDLACMHHDACTPEGGIPSCACNARFARETRAVVNSSRQPDDLRALAGLVEAAIPVIPCEP